VLGFIATSTTIDKLKTGAVDRAAAAVPVAQQ
jgi:hypothetical protein